MVGTIVSTANVDTPLMLSDVAVLRVISVDTSAAALALYSQPNQQGMAITVPLTGGTVLSGSWFIRMAVPAQVLYEVAE